ncbi:MAG: AbrB/MazE/SpoVT family DNA-binding domain-containing protein [Candidatus Sungbacteria bacterium]|nr:AbrB/MazE/SpoVT family DNA-binding domain-containing protein [Candidatus Sungbacteria bacterium]
MNYAMRTIGRKDVAMPIGKIGQRRQIVIPKEICDALGLQTGDFVEVKRVKATVVIKPKKLIDADEVLTPDQRAMVNAGLSKAEKDIKAGRVNGPFDSMTTLKRHLNAAHK